MITDVAASPSDTGRAPVSAAPVAPAQESHESPAADPAADPAPIAPRRWPLAGVVAFRWFAVYVALYLVPFPFTLIPGVGGLFGWWDAMWNAMLPWIGRTFLGLQAVRTGFPTGSGDTTAAYVQLFLFAALSLIAALMWTAAAWRTRAHPRLAAWTLSYVRYALAAALMSYGIAKVVPQQMPMPNAVRLTEMFGELSPMGLVWAFTGFSAPYQIFGGLMELVPGILLVFRRTALLGAMMAVPVMVNVVLLNYAYDVPVKLYSTHLLVMAIAVVAPHLERLYGVLLKNCPVAPGDLRALVSGRGPRAVRALAKALLLFLFGRQLAAAAANPPSRDIVPANRPFAGAWRVAQFTSTGAGALPWRAVALSDGRSSIRYANDSLDFLQTVNDSTAARLTLYPYDSLQVRDTANAVVLTYALKDRQSVNGVVMRQGDTLLVRGTVRGDSLSATLVRRDLSKMRLVSRGFRWIQEYPYNR